MSTKEPSQRPASQRGEAELMFFGIVVVICALISGSLMLLNWVKDTKDAKVRNRALAAMSRGTPAPVNTTKDPGEYYVECRKSPWALIDTKVKCQVMDESYGELYLIP